MASHKPRWMKPLAAPILLLGVALPAHADTVADVGENVVKHYFPKKIWLAEGENCISPAKAGSDSGLALYHLRKHPVNPDTQVVVFGLTFRTDCGYTGLTDAAVEYDVNQQDDWHRGDVENFSYSLRRDPSCSVGWRLHSVKTIAHSGDRPNETRETLVDSCEPFGELILALGKHAIYQDIKQCLERVPTEFCNKKSTAGFMLRDIGTDQNRLMNDLSEFFPAKRSGNQKKNPGEYVWKQTQDETGKVRPGGDGQFCGGWAADNRKDCVAAPSKGMTSDKRLPDPDMDRRWGKKNKDNDIFESKNWVADLNGDGKADYLYLRRNTDEYWALISKSDGTGFLSDRQWGKKNKDNDVFESKNWVADLNGDGKVDYLYLRRNTDEYWALISKPDGTGFLPDRKWGNKKKDHDVLDNYNWVADFDGDGKADYLYLRRNTNEYWALFTKADGTGFEDKALYVTARYPNQDIFENHNWVADFDGDGKADYLYLRRNTDEYWSPEINREHPRDDSESSTDSAAESVAQDVP